MSDTELEPRFLWYWEEEVARLQKLLSRATSPRRKARYGKRLQAAQARVLAIRLANPLQEKREAVARHWGDSEKASWEWFAPVGRLRIAIAVEMGWEGIDKRNLKDHPYYQISKFIDEEMTDEEAARLVNDHNALQAKIAE